MQEFDQQHKMDFSVKGAYLGLIAYLVLISILAIIFIFG
jgi:hypothetical protein